MKVEKILAKMRRTKYGHTFEDCEKVLTSIGYRLDRVKGSHHTFIKNGFPITLAKHRPMSPDAIKDVLRAWES